MKANRQPVEWADYMAEKAAAAQHPLLRDFYRADWPSSDTPIADLNLVALDIETTGLNVKTHSIVSIGMVPMTLSRIRSDMAWHQLIRPPGDLVPESVTFHHITHSDLQLAPRFGEVVESLLANLAGKVAVVHYHPIERNFLNAAVRRHCGEELLFPMVDTMQIEARLHPKRKPGWLMRLFGKTPISIRLANSRSRYGLPAYHAHHALTDALATAELLQAQVATHYSDDQAIGSLWL